MVVAEKCTVFYECWQMECCGTAFSKGDTVKWLVLENEEGCLNTPVDIGQIDYIYEAHSAEWTKLFVFEGEVEEIKILYEKCMPSKDNAKLLVAVGGKLVASGTAKGFDKKIDGMDASGYIVSLVKCTARPAEKNDVIFS